MEAKSGIKKFVILFIILLLPSLVYLLLYTAEHNYQQLPFIGPKEPVYSNDNKVIDTLYHKIGDFSLTDQNGVNFDFSSLKGKVVLVDFFFVTCPTICPKMTTNMAYIQKKFSNAADFHLLSITVNPEHDSSEVLLNYANKVKANQDNWTFLTGENKKIYDIAMKRFFVTASPDDIAPGGFIHTAQLILIDKNGHIRGYFDGTVHKEVKQNLSDAIDILFKEDFVPTKK